MGGGTKVSPPARSKLNSAISINVLISPIEGRQRVHNCTHIRADIQHFINSAPSPTLPRSDRYNGVNPRDSTCSDERPDFINVIDAAMVSPMSRSKGHHQCAQSNRREARVKMRETIKRSSLSSTFSARHHGCV